VGTKEVAYKRRVSPSTRNVNAGSSNRTRSRSSPGPAVNSSLELIGVAQDAMRALSESMNDIDAQAMMLRLADDYDKAGRSSGPARLH
jgi:hypothetical protein